MTTAAIIVAAGRGTRAGDGPPKQWRDLCGAPMLVQTLRALTAGGRIDIICVVIHPDDAGLASEHIAPHGDNVLLVHGGATRAASVRAGLEALAPTAPDLVLIHDAARPLLSLPVIDRVLAALAHHAAAAPALAVTDALWRGENGIVTAMADRTGLWRAQTPQGFRFAEILAAHRTTHGAAEAADDAAHDAADDAEVARMAGHAVAIVPGDADNFKVTHPADFGRAERILIQRKAGHDMRDIRVGNGFDVHQLGPGDHVVLCGVKIPFPQGLVGHSDADVGMHAATDALYGALAAGDIGVHFPPSDPQWKGAESHIFLRHACAMARDSGYTVSHIDVTLICEAPKIAPVAQAMRAAMAQIMDIDIGRVSVKATTSERLGFTGRGEGIAALATATLVQP